MEMTELFMHAWDQKGLKLSVKISFDDGKLMIVFYNKSVRPEDVETDPEFRREVRKNPDPLAEFQIELSDDQAAHFAEAVGSGFAQYDALQQETPRYIEGTNELYFLTTQDLFLTTVYIFQKIEDGFHFVSEIRLSHKVFGENCEIEINHTFFQTNQILDQMHGAMPTELMRSRSNHLFRRA